MPPLPVRPALRERYERRRQELASAAATVFAHRGYEQTTMADLAASLGLAAGALYHYFGSKEQLLIEICDQLMEPLLHRARALLDDPRGDDPQERLGALVHLWVAHVVEHRDHMLVFQQVRHVVEEGEQWRSVRERRKAFERLAASVLQDAGSAGIEPRLALAALLGMVNHTAQWYRPRGRLGPDEIADGYLALLRCQARGRWPRNFGA